MGGHQEWACTSPSFMHQGPRPPCFPCAGFGCSCRPRPPAHCRARAASDWHAGRTAPSGCTCSGTRCSGCRGNSARGCSHGCLRCRATLATGCQPGQVGGQSAHRACRRYEACTALAICLQRTSIHPPLLPSLCLPSPAGPPASRPLKRLRAATVPMGARAPAGRWMW